MISMIFLIKFMISLDATCAKLHSAIQLQLLLKCAWARGPHGISILI